MFSCCFRGSCGIANCWDSFDSICYHSSVSWCLHLPYFSSPGLLCSSLGVVDHSDLCSFSPSKFECLGTPFRANSVVVLGLLERWTFLLQLGIDWFVNFIGHVFILLVCCVHLLVWLFGLICVKISTLFGFHQSLRSLTFLIRLEIVLEMCSIQACSFQIASDGFWACNFPGCIGKFVTYFSSPGLLCSSLGVVDHSDLCSFLLQRASIEPTATLCAAVCLTEVTLSIPICVAISNAHSRAGSCFSHTSCSGSCHTCCLMGDCLGLDCLTYCSPIGVVKGHICC